MNLNDLDYHWQHKKFPDGQESSLLICMDSGLLIGSIEIVLMDWDVPLIQELAVIDAYRRKGVGSSLIYAVEAFLRDIGKPSVSLHASKKCDFLIPMYERMGYIKATEDEKYYLMVKRI